MTGIRHTRPAARKLQPAQARLVHIPIRYHRKETGHDRQGRAEEVRRIRQTREFERGTLELLRIGGAEIGRRTLQPGWRWSEHVKPLAGTDLCEAPHFQYHVQGILHVVMADGSEFDARPGDVTALPQGHDAWVVGDEPVVVVDWYGASNYARS